MSFGSFPQPSPFELEMLSRKELELREQLAEARQAKHQGEVPHEHHELIHKLEAELKKVVERLEHHRKS